MNNYHQKRHLWVLIGLAIVSLCARVESHAAQTSAQALATVIAPMTITRTADLRFGTFAPTATAGSVSIAPSGARSTPTSDVQLSAVDPGGAASFNLTGYSNAGYSITLPASATLTGPGANMTVSAFTSNPSGSGNLSSGGTGTLTVGGTLAVGASQAAGSYSGNFSVTVDYN